MKKTAILLSAILIGLLCLPGCASSRTQSAGAGYESITEADFKVTLDVPKAELKVGESETVTARFYNNSGETLPIANSGQELNVFVKEKADSTDNDIYWTLMRSVGNMQADSYIEKTYEFSPKAAGTYVAKAGGKASIILNGDESVGISDEKLKSLEVYADEVIIEVSQ